MNRRSVLLSLVPLTLCAFALSACSSSPPKSAAPPVTSVTTTTAQVISSSTVTIDGKSIAVPTEDGTDPIKAFGDTGQQIILSSTGVLPLTLYSALQKPVVWTNLTSHPVTLTILNVGLASVVVQPGATYSWVPNVLAFTFKTSNGDYGHVNVGAFSD